LLKVCASQKKAGPKSSAAAGRAEAARSRISTNAPKSVLLVIVLVDLEMLIYQFTPLSLGQKAPTLLVLYLLKRLRDRNSEHIRHVEYLPYAAGR
jgi:hypothetical protein